MEGITPLPLRSDGRPDWKALFESLELNEVVMIDEDPGGSPYAHGRRMGRIFRVRRVFGQYRIRRDR